MNGRWKWALIVNVGLSLSTAFGAEIQAELKGGNVDDGQWNHVGRDYAKLTKGVPEGLVVEFTEEDQEPEATGISLRSAVRGNFEVLAEYEILGLTPPSDGHGSGVGLTIESEYPRKIGLTLQRFDIPDVGPTFTSTRITTSDDGKRQFNPKRVKTDATSGKLRIKREGTKVRAYFTDGKGDFQELREVDFGDGDLTQVRFVADNGRTNYPLKVLLKNLTVNADDFPSAAASGSFGSGLRRILLIVVVIVIPTVLFVLVRRGSKPGASPAPVDKPA